MLFGGGIILSITWDRNLDVFGVKAERDRKGGHARILSAASATGQKREDFPKNLGRVFSSLGYDENSKVILGGHVEGAVCFELTLPLVGPQQAAQMLAYEIPRHVPCPMEDLAWCHRVIGTDTDTGRMRARVFAAPEKKWNETMAEVGSSGIFADLMAHPLLAHCSDAGLWLEGLDEEFYWDDKTHPHSEAGMRPSQFAGENAKAGFHVERWGGREKIEGKEKEFLPALILAEYVMSGSHKKDFRTLAQPPPELRPRRFRLLKIACLALFAAALLTGGALHARKWSDDRARLTRIQDEKERVSKALKQLRKENARIKKENELIESLEDVTPGNAEILQCVHFLASALPKHMWVTNLNSKGESIEVTIKTDTESDNITGYLGKSELFTTENVRKRRDSDGSVFVYVQLVYNKGKQAKKPTKNG